ARCALDVGPDHVHFAKLPPDLNTWARQSEEHLAKLCASLPGRVEQRVVAAEDAAPAIVAAALQDAVDLVVVAAGSKGPLETLLLGSTTEAVLRLSPLPVLVLRGAI
ncbi:MAG: universal stress protein, partial [Deltaproteobacteria bacterium]|nr:universal stress protein [Deltaproteobacteria bacterium]